MEVLVDRMGIAGGEHVIDLGGAPGFWSTCPHPLKITIVNNYSTTKKPENQDFGSIHEITLVEADACDLHAFPDMSFDIAVSNSVIEHVGDRSKQAALAAEARRLAPAYWVQTPSIWFPIEAHTYMPFWWFWPQWMRDRAMRDWRRKVPGWAQMIDEVTVIALKDLRDMFPDGEVYVERKAGFPKSYTIYRRGQRQDREARAPATA